MENKLFTTPQLKSRGWTKSLIQSFLMLPDETRPNPKYPNAGSPMKLYRCDRVEEIEASDDFREAKRRADARKESAKKGVATKSEKMWDYIDNLTIEVPLMEKEELIEAARRNSYSLDLRDGICLSIERMCVNYLRHCATKYEYELAAIARKTGAADAYFDIKKMVLDAIADKYDWLAAECHWQKKQTEKEREERQ